jgi:hypothetical protein
VAKVGNGWIVAGLALAVTEVCAFVWLIAAPDNPDLAPQKAALIISSAPEFNRSRRMERVLTTVRGSKSMNNNYFVDFEFHGNDSAAPVRARALFYWEGAWHFQQFSYGQPPNVETVWIDKTY